jgi:hypothetical protein
MSDESKSRPHSAEIVILKPEELPEIPYIERATVARRKIVRADWRYRNFEDFNALAAEFEDCDFRYSNLERGYFRDAKFTNCRFIGARFTECNFRGASFYRCDLKFVNFQRCLVDVRELVASLPPEPNIRREALQNLRANAVEVGDYAAEGLLVLQEIEATKRHYSYALRGFDSYYRKKYSSILSKFEAGAKLAWLQIAGQIWGHGEKPWRLLLSCLVILCVLSFINFWNVMPRVGWNESRGGLNALEYVIQLFLDMSPDARFRGYVTVDYLVVVMRYVYIGLFISILYKSISHR